MKNEYQVVKQLMLTEKSMLQSEGTIRKYTFRVDPRANKHEIKDAVEKLFGVKVTQVNTMTRKGKKKRERTQNFGMTASWKRAVVTLAEGYEIGTN